jgi:hypothetical protein
MNGCWDTGQLLRVSDETRHVPIITIRNLDSWAVELY